MDDHACAAFVGSTTSDIEALVVTLYLLLFLSGIALLVYSVYRLVFKLRRGKAYKNRWRSLGILLRESDAVVRINTMVFLFVFPNVFYFRKATHVLASY